MLKETLSKLYGGPTYLTIPCFIRTASSILSYQQPILHKNVLAQMLHQSLKGLNTEGNTIDMVPVILCPKDFLIDGLDAKGCYVYDFVQNQMIYGALHMDCNVEKPYSIGIGYLATERQPKFEQQFVQCSSLLDDIQIDVIHKELSMQLYDEPQQVYVTHLIYK